MQEFVYLKKCSQCGRIYRHGQWKYVDVVKVCRDHNFPPECIKFHHTLCDVDECKKVRYKKL